MNLLALLLGLFLEHQLTHLLHLRELRWFDDYFDRGLRHLARLGGWRALVVTVIIVLLPVVPVAAVALLARDVLLGVPYLAFAVVMLLFSLGPRNLSEEVEDYVIADQQGDDGLASRVAKELLEREPPAGAGARVRAVEEAIFVQANNRLFGVILWFMLLGPVGAWLFRVADLMRRRTMFEANRVSAQSGTQPAYVHAVQRVHGVLAWLPARLLALGYALAGSFEDAVSDWRAYYQDCSEHFFEVNDDVLACAGVGAMRGRPPGEDAAPAVGTRAVRNAMSLVHRTLIVWLTGIALLTLAGWAV